MGGIGKQVPRGLHYVCARGGCCPYELMLNNWRQFLVPGHLVYTYKVFLKSMAPVEGLA